MASISTPSTTSATGLPHYVSLDSLRGICACAVVFYHMPTTGIIPRISFVQNSWLFVDFFFVLSGFVIAASYGERLENGFSIRRFMALRLGRVYPLHLAVILAFLLMELAALAIGRGEGARAPFTDTRTVSSLITNVTLTQIFGFHDRVVWNSPSWSIAAEVWTYLLAAAGLATLKGRFRLALLATSVLAPAYLALIDDKGLDRTYDLALLRCMYGFALGMLAYDIHRWLARFPLGSGLATALEVAAVVATILLVSSVPTGRADLLFPPLFALVVLAFSRDAGSVSDLLSTGPFRLVGALSYSIYMIHVFVIGRFIDIAGITGRVVRVDLVETIFFYGGNTKALSGPGLLPDALALLCLIGIITLAWFSYTLIEIPCRNASRRWAERVHGGRPPRGALAGSFAAADASFRSGESAAPAGSARRVDAGHHQGVANAD